MRSQAPVKVRVIFDMIEINVTDKNQLKTKPRCETRGPRTWWKWKWYLIWSKGKWKSIKNKTWAWNMRSQAPVKVSLHWLHRRHTRFPLEGGGSQPWKGRLWRTSNIAYALYHHMRSFHHVATTTRCNIVFPYLHTPHYVSKTPPSSLSKSSGPAVEASVIAFCGEGSSPSSFCSHLWE